MPKIVNLPLITALTIAASAVFPISQGGVTYKETMGDVRTALMAGGGGFSATDDLAIRNIATVGSLAVGTTANVVGNFSVATNKFTVIATSGNTVVAGTLGVTGLATFTGAATVGTTLGVTGTASINSGLTAGIGLTLGGGIRIERTANSARFLDITLEAGQVNFIGPAAAGFPFQFTNGASYSFDNAVSMGALTATTGHFTGNGTFDSSVTMGGSGVELKVGVGGGNSGLTLSQDWRLRRENAVTGDFIIENGAAVQRFRIEAATGATIVGTDPTGAQTFRTQSGHFGAAVLMDAGVTVLGGSSGATVATLTAFDTATTPLLAFQRSGGAVAGKLEYDNAITAMALGTTTNHNLVFKTNGTAVLTLASTGGATFAGALTNVGAATLDTGASGSSFGGALTIGGALSGVTTAALSGRLTTSNNIKFSAATANLIGGATAIQFLNTAETTANMIIADGGAVTFRGGISGVTTMSHTGDLTTGGNASIGASSTGSAVLLVGPAAPSTNGSGFIKFVTSNSVKNWAITTNNLTGANMEFIPSTANGGSTFSTSAFGISPLSGSWFGADPGGGQFLRIGGSGRFTGVLTLDGGSSSTAGIVLSAGLIQFFGNTTGAGTALLSTNCPAITVAAPYTWLKAMAADGSVVYTPAWK